MICVSNYLKKSLNKARLCRYIDCLPGFFLSQPFILQLRAGPGQSFTSLWKMHPELSSEALRSWTSVICLWCQGAWVTVSPESPSDLIHDDVVLWDWALSGLRVARWLWRLWPVAEDSWEAGPGQTWQQRTNFPRRNLLVVVVRVMTRCFLSHCLLVTVAWLQESVGHCDILQYLDNFPTINFYDNDTANGPVSMSRDVGIWETEDVFVPPWRWTPPVPEREDCKFAKHTNIYDLCICTFRSDNFFRSDHLFDWKVLKLNYISIHCFLNSTVHIYLLQPPSFHVRFGTSNISLFLAFCDKDVIS